MVFIRFIIILLCLQWSASLWAVPGDENWEALGGSIAGLSDEADAIARYGSDIYVGGTGEVVGNQIVNNVAKWNGVVWSALGSGVNGDVEALAIDNSGNVYAGGLFTEASGISANHIAKWNGSNWSALGSGLDGDVEALAIDSNGHVYVAGFFSNAGGVPANGIAKWNGSNWSALSSGVEGFIQALAIDSNDNLYVGGNISEAGGLTASHLAKWNGVAWSVTDLNVTGYHVGALFVDMSNDDVYIGGNFTEVNSVSVNNIAKWNGTVWSALGAGVGEQYSGAVNSLALDSNNNLYAGGFFSIAGGVSITHFAKWNGLTWSQVGAEPMVDSVDALLIDANDNVYAAGEFTKVGDVPATHIAKWDGSVWSGLGSGTNDDIETIVFDSLGNMYVGGDFISFNGLPIAYIAKWNGVAWSALGSGLNEEVDALAIDSNDNLYVGGEFTEAGGIPANYVAKWDGSTWSALGLGLGPAGMGTEVRALAVDGNNDLYVGGDFTTAGGISASNIAKWNGVAWSALDLGVNSAVRALAVDASNALYAGGYFSTAGGVSVNKIAKWNGVAWSGLDIGMDGSVYSLVFDQNNHLYAGGSFTNAGGVIANGVGKWDGATWSALSTGVSNFYPEIETLAISDSNILYAGGWFKEVDGAIGNYIAQWDGANWSALGSGTSQSINTSAFDGDGNLYVGGNFALAGGELSIYVAKWAPPVLSHTGFLHIFYGDDEDESFGSSVAAAGDVNNDGYSDVIVGAVQDDNYGNDSGGARVFSGVDGEVLYSYYGDSAGDFFGYAVNSAGDVNNDGYDDFIVGANSDDKPGTESGSATVYSGANGSVLYALSGTTYNYLGVSVGRMGDVNNDGYSDFFVGSLDNGSFDFAGRIRVYSGKNGSILYTRYGDSPNDFFSRAANNAGDVNNDGYDDLVVGMDQDDNNGAESGGARVFSGINGATLYTFSGDDAGDELGRSVNAAGDVNNDGYGDIVVGTPYDDDNGANAGLARVYSGIDGSTLYTVRGIEAGVNLGYSVGAAGDLNQDGYDDFIVGAPSDETGKVRVYNGIDGTVLYVYAGDNSGDLMGWSVAGAGDVNGDNYSDVIVGSLNGKKYGLTTGMVRVFSGKAFWEDTDNDGRNNAFDNDDDNDGELDLTDLFPLDPTEWFDTDFDGLGNNADWDDDNDGVPDVVDAEPLNNANSNEVALPLDSVYKGGQSGAELITQ